MENRPVFQFESYRDYLQSLLTAFPGRKRALSRAQLSKLMGYRSPRLVSMVIQGARIPSREFLLKLAQTVDFTALEFQYFELLVLRELALRKGQSTTAVDHRISLLKGRVFTTHKLEFQDFAHISEWHHLPLLDLATSPSFVECPEWIARKLRGKISAMQAQKSLERLLDIGLLERDPKSGKLRRCADNIQVSGEVPSKAGISHHKQMLERASESLDECFKQSREFSTNSISFAPERLGEARVMIQEFVTEFIRKFEVGDPNEVFQLGIQLFPHTDLKSPDSKS